MDLAPIILFAYDRPSHTRKTLEALKSNELAKDSVLYIYADGPKANSSDDELSSIDQVRKVMKEKDWCGKVEVQERKQNLGLARNIIDGVTEVINKYGKVIVLEDDIVTGKYFLNFMNDGLNIYQDEKKVFGISGYKYPSCKDISAPTYFLPIFSSWGFATWKDRWVKVSFNGNYLMKEIEDQSLVGQLDFGGNPFYQMLKDQINGKNDSWAVRFYASMFLEDSYFLYPNKSMVKNIGFDNTGVHCGYDDYYSIAKISQKRVKIIKNKVKLNNRVVKNINKSFQAKFNPKSYHTTPIKKLTLKFLRRMNLI